MDAFSGLPSPVGSSPLFGHAEGPPSIETGPLRAQMSRRIWMYSRVRANGFANGIPYQPSTTCGPETPSPRMKRPPERGSIVIADIAVIAGWRADICVIAVPSFRFDVWEPHHVSGVSPSDP